MGAAFIGAHVVLRGGDHCGRDRGPSQCIQPIEEHSRRDNFLPPLIARDDQHRSRRGRLSERGEGREQDEQKRSIRAGHHRGIDSTPSGEGCESHRQHSGRRNERRPRHSCPPRWANFHRQKRQGRRHAEKCRSPCLAAARDPKPKYHHARSESSSQRIGCPCCTDPYPFVVRPRDECQRFPADQWTAQKRRLIGGGVPRPCRPPRQRPGSEPPPPRHRHLATQYARHWAVHAVRWPTRCDGQPITHFKSHHRCGGERNPKHAVCFTANTRCGSQPPTSHAHAAHLRPLRQRQSNWFAV